MSRAAFLRRFRRLSRSDRRLLAEALATLALSSAAIRLLPFRRIAELASRRPARAQAAGASTQWGRRVRWAVNAWGKRVPWRAVCFQRGLAAHLMLRRRGLPSVLHYGVTQDGDQGLAAHVWVSLGGYAVTGGEDAPRFSRLASFPPEEPAADAMP
jgi:hypothetical protein